MRRTATGRFLVGGDGGTLAKRNVGAAGWAKAGDSGTKRRLFGGAIGGGTRLAVGWLGTVTVSKNDGAWRLAKGVEFVNIEDVIHDGDRFLAVGKGGKVGLSADGGTWAFHDSGATAWLKHITTGGGQYVAVGTRGTVVSSVNGTKWTERNTPTSSGLESVAFGNGRFVAVGFKGTILYSDNGQRWLTAKSGTTEWLNDVTFGGGMFLTVGANGTLLTSPDGKAWLRRSSGTETSLGGVAFGDRRFIIAGRAGLILESGQLAAPPEPPTLTAALAKGGKPRLILAGQARGNFIASRFRPICDSGEYSNSSRARPSRWSLLTSRPRRSAITFTVPSRRSHFGFRLAKGGVRFCRDKLKTNEHFFEVIQLDDAALLRSMR